jgi:hypothetical protein
VKSTIVFPARPSRSRPEQPPDVAVDGVNARQVIAGPGLHLGAVEAGHVRDGGIEGADRHGIGLRHGPVGQVGLAEVQQERGLIAAR